MNNEENMINNVETNETNNLEVPVTEEVAQPVTEEVAQPVAEEVQPTETPVVEQPVETTPVVPQPTPVEPVQPVQPQPVQPVQPMRFDPQTGKPIIPPQQPMNNGYYPNNMPPQNFNYNQGKKGGHGLLIAIVIIIFILMATVIGILLFNNSNKSNSDNSGKSSNTSKNVNEYENPIGSSKTTKNNNKNNTKTDNKTTTTTDKDKDKDKDSGKTTNTGNDNDKDNKTTTTTTTTTSSDDKTIKFMGYEFTKLDGYKYEVHEYSDDYKILNVWNDDNLYTIMLSEGTLADVKGAIDDYKEMYKDTYDSMKDYTKTINSKECVIFENVYGSLEFYEFYTETPDKKYIISVEGHNYDYDFNNDVITEFGKIISAMK